MERLQQDGWSEIRLEEGLGSEPAWKRGPVTSRSQHRPTGMRTHSVFAHPELDRDLSPRLRKQERLQVREWEVSQSRKGEFQAEEAVARIMAPE